MEGWVKLHRKMINWEWYQDANTFKLFCHFLLIANVADKKWKGITIKRGQFVRTLANLAAETGLTVDEVRTAIKHLESTNEITRLKSGKNVVFSIVGFERYQETSHDCPNEIPNQTQINPTLIPQSKEYIKNDKKEKKNIYGAYKHVRLKSSEREELVGSYGEEMTDKCITFLDEYIEMKGYKAKSHYLCIKKWVVDAVKERDRKKGSSKNQFNSYQQGTSNQTVSEFEDLFMREANGG